jgi:DNA-binding MarR family transcriptional regulator
MIVDNQKITQVLRDWAEVFMRRSMRDFKRFMDESGLSASQLNTMMRLYHQGKCGMTDIGDHLGVTNAAASQMVDRMVQQGYFVRSEDSSDRRVRHVTLTPKAEALVQAGIEARRRWLEDLTATLPGEERDSILHALTLLTETARKLDE